MPKNHKKPHIVILGGGFGGIYTFLNLRRQFPAQLVDITIINRTNYFLFTPMLHEVATGGLAHHQVVEAIRSITYKKGGNLHVAEVKKINTVQKIVETSIGPVAYDFLVVATGATTAFYNIPGAAEHGLVLKTLSDAIKIRNRFIWAFEQASETKDSTERRRLLTFVLVGGGATGVELAAEMTDLFFDTFRKFFCGKIPSDEVTIHLLSGDQTILKNFSNNIQARAKLILGEKGVRIMTGARVVSVDRRGVKLEDGSSIESEHVLWLAGVSPNVPPVDKPFLTGRAGRMLIDKKMRAVDHPHVYALGDVATFQDEFLPMHAQAAVQAAAIVAKNLAKEIRGGTPMSGGQPAFSAWQGLADFKYRPIGDLVSLGQWQAVGDTMGLIWEGPLAWFVWRTVYLFKFASWPKRIKIAVDWTIDMFYPRDITRA